MLLMDEMKSLIRKCFSNTKLESPEETDKEAKKCALKEWNKLRKKFLKSQKRQKSLAIYVGILNGHFVYKENILSGRFTKRWLGHIKYHSQTIYWLRKFADEEGIKAIECYNGSYDWTNRKQESLVMWEYILLYDQLSSH